jgi:transposase
VAELKQLVATLMERLNRNSRNSPLPPSSDGPGARSSSEQKNKGDAQRKRGGQPGHGGHKRQLLPAEQVDHVVDLFPEQCENCWQPLPRESDGDPTRYQVTEMPPVRPQTTEYRRHAVTCACGYTTLAKVDEMPASPFGPRMMSLVALLTGVYHLSRRQTVVLMHDLLGVHLSLGAVSAVEERVSVALEPAVNEAWKKIDTSTVKHADATSWLQAGKLRSLWTIATKAMTVFRILIDGSTESIRPLFGACLGILVSDRATVFSFWAMVRRQICWAHLLRKFVSFSERDGPARTFGRELLDYAALVFRYWRDHRAGAIDRETYRAWMAPVRAQVEDCLARAVAADIREVSGSCADILAHKEALWTFVERDDVEPTNNHAERELRAFVLWRKRSFGAQSERGNVFAERVMTVAHTARKQGKNVLAFITDCCRAQLEKTVGPSLFTAELAA